MKTIGFIFALLAIGCADSEGIEQVEQATVITGPEHTRLRGWLTDAANECKRDANMREQLGSCVPSWAACSDEVNRWFWAMPDQCVAEYADWIQCYAYEEQPTACNYWDPWEWNNGGLQVALAPKSVDCDEQIWDWGKCWISNAPLTPELQEPRLKNALKKNMITKCEDNCLSKYSYLGCSALNERHEVFECFSQCDETLFFTPLKCYDELDRYYACEDSHEYYGQMYTCDSNGVPIITTDWCAYERYSLRFCQGFEPPR